MQHKPVRKSGYLSNRLPLSITLISGADAVVNTAAPHFGEESCIQGVNGSGTIFFSGCNLRCVFCQVGLAIINSDL
jgi:hypothetical protein